MKLYYYSSMLFLRTFFMFIFLFSLVGTNWSFANKIKKHTKMIVRTVGMITDPIEASNIIINKDVDMIAIAGAFLSKPRWVWDAAKVLNHDIEVPPQYDRRI